MEEGGYNIPKIFYTRLHIDENGQIRKGLAPNYIGDTSIHTLFNTDSTIFCVSYTDGAYLENFWDHDEHRFPVVYRDLYRADTDTSICNFELYYSGYNRTGFKFDRVYWQYQNSLIGVDYTIPYNKIKNRLITFLDTTESGGFKPQIYYVSGVHGIWSPQNYIDQPVVSAGEAYDYQRTTSPPQWYNCFNCDYRAMNLNFRSRPIWYTNVVTYGITDSLAKIMHVPQEIFVELENLSVSTVDVGRLGQAHLAARGSIYQNDWQRNHRIYNKRDEHETIPAPPLPIRTSGEYFFKTSSQVIARNIYSFGTDSLSFGISSATIHGQEYPILPKSLESPFIAMKSPDTLSTDWFVVDDFEELRLITSGNTPERLTALLERRSDGSVWDIECTAGDQMRLSNELIDLLNGDNEEYRVSICSNGGAQFHPETALVESEENGFEKVRMKENKLLQLRDNDPKQTILIYPNPARDEIRMTIKGTARCEIIIVSAIGNETVRLFSEGGKTVTVNTSSFPSGIYFVRVRRGEIGDVTLPFVVVH